MAYTEADKRYKRGKAGKAASARYFQRLTPEQRALRNIKHQVWRKANPEKDRKHQKWTKIKMAYGLTKEQWEAAFMAQGQKCAGCGTPTPSSKRGWCTDHCHATGKFRGIVCLQCNVALGMAKDDPERLRRLAVYLEERNRCPNASA
jgi:hypothetical protein